MPLKRFSRYSNPPVSTNATQIKDLDLNEAFVGHFKMSFIVLLMGSPKLFTGRSKDLYGEEVLRSDRG